MPDNTRQRVEDEWFAQHEEELLRQARRSHQERMRQLEASQSEGEARRLRELHFRRCPKCGNEMLVKHIEGIEIEQCSTCQGLFFDRGELDELLLKKAAVRKGFFRKLTGI